MQSVVSALWKKRGEIADEAVAAVSPASCVTVFSIVVSLLLSKLKTGWNHFPYQEVVASFFSLRPSWLQKGRALL